MISQIQRMKSLNYKTTFSRYRDFESATNFAEIELDLINEITKELRRRHV